MKERNVLFKDALNTFYLRLYGIAHMVKNHSDNGRGNRISLHRWIHFRINNNGPSRRQDSTYHGHCYTSCGVLAGSRCSGWKEGFYLTTHSIRLYDVRHVVKDPSYSEREREETRYRHMGYSSD